jgi:hypothetical protein
MVTRLQLAGDVNSDHCNVFRLQPKSNVKLPKKMGLKLTPIRFSRRIRMTQIRHGYPDDWRLLENSQICLVATLPVRM